MGRENGRLGTGRKGEIGWAMAWKVALGVCRDRRRRRQAAEGFGLRGGEEKRLAGGVCRGARGRRGRDHRFGKGVGDHGSGSMGGLWAVGLLGLLAWSGLGLSVCTVQPLARVCRDRDRLQRLGLGLAVPLLSLSLHLHASPTPVSPFHLQLPPYWMLAPAPTRSSWLPP